VLTTLILILTLVLSLCLQAYISLTLYRGFSLEMMRPKGDLNPLSPKFLLASHRWQSWPGEKGEMNPLKSPGPILCTLGVVVWVLNCFRDYGHTLCFVVAMWRLPRGESEMTRSSDMFALVTVSRQRVCWAASIASIRFTVASCLLAIGAKRLAVARSPLELALTAATLGFALDVPRRAWMWGSSIQRLGHASYDWLHAKSD
jgi:hypothetical protein